MIENDIENYVENYVEYYNARRRGVSKPYLDAKFALEKLETANLLTPDIRTGLLVVYNTRPDTWDAYVRVLGVDLVRYVGW